MSPPPSLSNFNNGYERQRFRLLSYNIQVGIDINAYRHYLTHGWKHVLPYKGRLDTLESISRQIRGFDLVGLQESDSGSLRSGFMSQTEVIAKLAHFPYWHEKTNRRLGRIASHSIGAVCRMRPNNVTKLSLPGFMPGRGALLLEFGSMAEALGIMIVHLALGRRARALQLEYISDVLSEFKHVVVMGDFNSPLNSPEMVNFFRETGFAQPTLRVNTWPSWRPVRNYDHILITPSVQVDNVRTLESSHSDHLPVAMDIILPEDFGAQRAHNTDLAALGQL